MILLLLLLKLYEKFIMLKLLRAEELPKSLCGISTSNSLHGRGNATRPITVG